MAKYIVTATQGNYTEDFKLECEDDREATAQAAVSIFIRSIAGGVWARGAIELKNEDGRVIETMEAK